MLHEAPEAEGTPRRRRRRRRPVDAAGGGVELGDLPKGCGAGAESIGTVWMLMADSWRNVGKSMESYGNFMETLRILMVIFFS